MSRFLSALRGEAVDRPPVWIMRQAGRYLPEYRATREEAGSFVALCRRPDLAAEVTLQPIRRFGFDAAIIFCDILLPLAPLGVEFEFPDAGGPRIQAPLLDAQAWAHLAVPADTRGTAYVAEAIGLVRAALPSEVALIGFCGSPWTLASYLVEGGTSRDHARAKAALYRDPEAFVRMTDVLADAMAAYLHQQVGAGAQAVQIFDSWAGALSAEDYGRFAAPSLRRLLAGIGTDVPRIVYVGNGAHLVGVLADLPCEAVGVDWRTDLGAASVALGGKTVQGNLDPALLFTEPPTVRRATAAMLADAPRLGYVANLGHGILPETPIGNVEAFLDAVRRPA